MGNLGTHRNLADLALSHGFSDAAHQPDLQEVFGESPSQARQRRPAWRGGAPGQVVCTQDQAAAGPGS
jgi:hypothetical protein